MQLATVPFLWSPSSGGRKHAARLIIAITIFFGSVLTVPATTLYWIGDSESSDNIDQDDNWDGNGIIPALGDNLYFNAAYDRSSPYNNYGNSSYFGDLISFEGAGHIRWRGDRTAVFKFENSNNGSLFEAEATLSNRVGSDLQINPVGSGGVKVNNVEIEAGRQLQIFGTNLLEVAGVISQTGTGTAAVAINSAATVTFRGANSYTGDTFINAGRLELASTGSVAGAIKLAAASNGSATTELRLIDYDGGYSEDAAITVGAGSFGRKTISSTNSFGTNTLSGVITLNAAVTFNVVNSGGRLALTNNLSGAQTATKQGTGTLLVNPASTNGFAPSRVAVQSGTLLLGRSHAVADTTAVTLSGGTLSMGNSGGASNSDTVGALTLTANSSIVLDTGNGSGLLTFSSLDTAGYVNNARLRIDNWSGTPGASGTDDRIVFSSFNGSDATTQNFLANVFWIDQGITGATFLPSGELVPIPEPSTWAAGILAIVAVGWTQRRRLQSALGSLKAGYWSSR